MKMFAITLALAGSAAVAPLSAQARPVILNPGQQSGANCAYTRTNSTVGDVIFGRANTSTCQDVYSREDGAWYQIGRGNTYERRIQDRNGNLVIQHARRNPNGTFTILNTRSGVNDKQWRKAQQRQARTSQDCTYSQSTNSVGDIIFGRSGNNTTNCVDNTSNRVNGGWYQVGRDNSGATIYERQTRDRNGNLIVQRARRNSNGTLSVISTRNAGNVNGGYNNSTYNNGTYNNGTYNTRARENEQGDNDNDHGKGKKYKDHGKGKGHDKD
jgi:hypothetical protein